MQCLTLNQVFQLATKFLRAPPDPWNDSGPIPQLYKAIIDLSARLVVLNYGEKIAEGEPREVLTHRAVVEAYLGE
ncbi:MAG: hypothetical protein CVU57_04895 [Deltaproteobacteria bacterium HGW-Deltaproteobacteria-15]|nr:MAG: hypothetical protein CVU57_04895 [Deltaproteobacteria bacterium HGW-Deltaproteobacteria-15]